MSLTTRIQAVQRSSLDWIVGQFPGLRLDQRAEEMVSQFAGFVPRQSQVLDIGGRWGFYVEPLRRQRDCDVTVLDVVKPAFHRVPVVIYDGQRVPFPDKSFDVSLMVTVLHHVQAPEKLLTEAKRVTRGLIVVVEDLYHHTAGRLWTILRDMFFNLEFVGHPRQFRRKDEWSDCFRKLGLKVEFEKEIYMFLLGLRILNGIFVLRADDE